MVEVQQIDVSGLGFLINGIRHALIGTGHEGDLSKITQDESRLLAVEIAAQISPRTEAAGNKKVKRDIGKFLSSPRVNIQSHHQGGGDILWISSGPDFLTGVRKDDYHGVSTDSGYAKFLYRESKAKGDRGPAYTTLGKRGHQTVQILNRTVFSPIAKRRFTEDLQSHVGRAKASFMQTAIKLGHNNVPQWIRRHIPTPKSIFNDGGMSNPESPSIEFGSKARGISHFTDKVNRAVRNRGAKMNQKLRNILFGYAQDVHAKRHPRRHFKPGQPNASP